MATKETKMSIWALDPQVQLEQIPELLGIDYSREIDYLQEFELSELDKKLLNRWVEYDQAHGFNIQQQEVLGTVVRYIIAKAYFETSAPPESAIIEGYGPLPRDRRIAPNEMPVLFFESHRRVYVIVTGSDYKTRHIRTVLMGGGRLSDENHRRWGKVQTKEISNYSFNSEFFYWLISQQNSTITVGDINLDISDIRYLSQTGTERTDVRHESQGANITDEAISKTGLGVNSRVGQVGTTIGFTGGNYRLILFENGSVWIDNNLSSINGTTGELEPFESNLEIGSLSLYASILPLLKTAFNSDRDQGRWTVELQANARKLWALGAINELCSENEIAINEIQSLEWFT